MSNLRNLHVHFNAKDWSYTSLYNAFYRMQGNISNFRDVAHRLRINVLVSL